MSVNINTTINKVAHWPPLVYFLMAAVGLIFWCGGTSIQVLTSEAWIGRYAVGHISLVPFVQIWEFVHGGLPDGMLVPFCFGWGVQLALIFASVGIELPREPQWRYYGCWFIIIVLLGANSCGDWQYATPYEFWGQLGFTAVIWFLTFFVGLLTIMAVKHGMHVLRHG